MICNNDNKGDDDDDYDDGDGLKEAYKDYNDLRQR